MHRKVYHIADKIDSRKIAEFLSKDGQLLPPLLDLICNAEQAVDELIDVFGKAAIESVLLLSAQQIAGPKQPGKVTGDICRTSKKRTGQMCDEVGVFYGSKARQREVKTIS